MELMVFQNIKVGTAISGEDLEKDLKKSKKLLKIMK